MINLAEHAGALHEGDELPVLPEVHYLRNLLLPRQNCNNQLPVVRLVAIVGKQGIVDDVLGSYHTRAWQRLVLAACVRHIRHKLSFGSQPGGLLPYELD